MRSSIAVSLALGLLGVDLVAASVCMPQLSSSVVTGASLTTSSETASSSLSTATESSSASTTVSLASSDTTQATTSDISSSTSTESASTSSSEVVSESFTTFTTRTTTAESATTSSSEVASESSTASTESTTATTVESSTAQTTTTDFSTTESSKVTTTSSARSTNPTFEIFVRGDAVDGQPIKSLPSGEGPTLFIPSNEDYEVVAFYVEEGTGHLKTLFSDYYLCIGYQWTYTEFNILPAYVQLCNTRSFNNDAANRLKHITCQLTGVNRLSCSAPGGYCYNWLEGPRQTVRGRCDTVPGITFTEFFARSDNNRDDYVVFLGPNASFGGYEHVIAMRNPNN